MPATILLSHPLHSGTPAYGGGPGFQLEQLSSIAAGDHANTARWSFSNHLGSHVDAPRHFHAAGLALDELPPAFWIFHRVAVVEAAPPKGSLFVEPQSVLAALQADTELLLVKTGAGAYRQERRFWAANPGFPAALGRVLRRDYPALRAFGTDSLSLSSWPHRAEGRRAHRAFLQPPQPFVVLEDLDLSALTPTSAINRVTVAPLLARSADGAPCTVFAELA